MKEYHKINSIYKRDSKGNFTNEFAQPEFEYLFENQWVGTEKIDGTNIRIMWDKDTVRIGGKTDNAQIPVFLLDKLNKLFNAEKMLKVFPNAEVCLYGEGYGAKIQKGGGNYISDGVDFILFDIKIGDFWLKRDDVDNIAEQLGIKSVPILFNGTLKEAITYVKNGVKSEIANTEAEGIVLVPMCELQTRSGHRIITKLKTKDFKVS